MMTPGLFFLCLFTLVFSLKFASFRKLRRCLVDYLKALTVFLRAAKSSFDHKILDNILTKVWSLSFRLCIVASNIYVFFLLFLRIGASQFASLLLCCLPYLFFCHLKNEL